MESTLRERTLGERALWVGAWVFVACLVVQFFFVGLDIFEALGESELHRDFAYTYGWLTPALVLLAGLTRAPRRVLFVAVILLVAFAVQTYLPLLAEGAPWVAATHSVLALVILWLAVWFAQLAGRNPGPSGTEGR